MTFFGKALVFLNLIFGIGAAVTGTSLYTQRPGWFADNKDDKGAGSPWSFAQLQADVDAQGKAANLANVNWTTHYKALDALEKNRDTRYLKMFGERIDGKGKTGTGFLDYARAGKKDANGGNGGPAFLNFPEDANTKLLDLNVAEDAKSIVRGPDDQPLKGADTLLGRFQDDAKEAETQAFLSKDLRGKQSMLGIQIVDVQNKIYKQRDIRDNLVVEASRLEAFEVNATEHMATVTRRRDQLIGRLAPFRSLEKK